MRIGIYAGCFDPPHNGHIWVIEEGLKLFDQLHVVIGPNPGKRSTFSETERIKMLMDSVRSPKLTVDLMAGRNIIDHACVLACREDVNESDIFLLRGIRDADDFEYESEIQAGLQRLSDEVHFQYVIPPRELTILSSSLVKDRWARYGYDTVSKMVPEAVLNKMREYADLATADAVASIFDTTTAGFAPAPSRGLRLHSSSGHKLLFEDLPPEPKVNLVYFGKMRGFFDKLVREGFVKYPEKVTAAQVRKMLDPFPFDVVSSETFLLREIPIESVRPTGNRYLPCSESLGPIIVDVNPDLMDAYTFESLGPVIVIEGKHRWLDAKERGEESILAWVGEKALKELKL
jgi:pantetheine-phosphate adenylyltransferase